MTRAATISRSSVLVTSLLSSRDRFDRAARFARRDRPPPNHPSACSRTAMTSSACLRSAAYLSNVTIRDDIYHLIPGVNPLHPGRLDTRPDPPADNWESPI